jgi:hypothetical protein
LFEGKILPLKNVCRRDRQRRPSDERAAADVPATALRTDWSTLLRGWLLTAQGKVAVG